jgi:NTP pyrophosphatase (non-canonical NTP hydrolase)
MTFDEYQKQAQTTAIYPGKGQNITYPVLGLNGEAGEVAEKLKKIFRDKNGEFSQEDKFKIVMELGDVLWYLSDIALEMGFSLENVAILNIQKLSSRKDRNKIHGNGDFR